MEIKLPPELERAIDYEIGFKPGLNRRHFTLEALRQHCHKLKLEREKAARDGRPVNPYPNY